MQNVPWRVFKLLKIFPPGLARWVLRGFFMEDFGGVRVEGLSLRRRKVLWAPSWTLSQHGLQLMVAPCVLIPARLYQSFPTWASLPVFGQL